MPHLRIRARLLLAGLLLAAAVRAQNTIGIPTLIDYAKQACTAGTQNRVIAQGSSGLLSFGNGQGLLSFGGSFWHLHPLPNKTIVRSVVVTGGCIYTAGQSELGYFSSAANAEVDCKNSEPASSAMSLVHKLEILSRIKEDLVRFRNSDHPEIGLSTKERVRLMNISTRGVEISCYRLEKKLGLTGEEANPMEVSTRLANGEESGLEASNEDAGEKWQWMGDFTQMIF